MLPIFNEYIKYLSDNGVNLPLSEGTFWVDNVTIKGFDKQGIERKIYKIIVDDDLKISYKSYTLPQKVINSGWETWEETINRNKDRLDKLEKDSIDLILNKCAKYPEHRNVVLNSTGKDSMVVTHLCEKSGIEFQNYFTNSTIEYAHSVRLAKKMGFIFMHPQKERSFFEWQKRTHMIPTKLHRTCCTYFQEQPTLEFFNKKEKLLFFLGMRKEESKKRATYEHDWRNPIWGKRRPWEGLLPVLDWTELDIWLYILKENIEFNSLYRQGYERCGCNNSICPFSKKKVWSLDKYFYPKQFERWQNIVKTDFIEHNKWIATNLTLSEYMVRWNHSEIPDTPSKECIAEFAKYNHLDYDIAKKYFKKTCANCGKTIRHKYEIGMCMKYEGEEPKKYLCKECFMSEYNFTEEEYDERVQAFKYRDCDLL